MLSSIQIAGIRTFFPKKIRQEKLKKFIKVFELYQIFLHNFLCQNVQIFPNYILLARKINNFWSGSISNIHSISII